MNKIIESSDKQINKERRRFLDMLSKGGISSSILRASPLLGGAMVSRFAEAQNGGAKKLVMIYHPNGAPKGKWAPGSRVATNPLQAHMSNIALREMQSAGTSHGRLDYAAGRNYNTPATQSTFNMQVADAIGHLTPYASMELGVHTKNTGGDINVKNGTKIPLEDNPSAVLSRFFGSTPPPTSGGGGGGLTIYDRRLKVAQANMEAITALQNKLGAHEREKLEFHMDSLSQLEQEIIRMQMANSNTGGSTGGGGGGSCSAPSLPSGSTPLQTYRAQGSIAAKALSCGLTNVVSIQFNETQASWFGNDGTADAVNYAGDHHSAIHSGGFDKIPDFIAYMNKGVAHLISELKKENVFNDTVVVVFSEMGDPSHTNEDMPVIVASGINGLQTGYRKDSGSVHWGVFGDVARLMGLSSEIGGKIGNYGNGGHVV